MNENDLEDERKLQRIFVKNERQEMADVRFCFNIIDFPARFLQTSIARKSGAFFFARAEIRRSRAIFRPEISARRLNPPKILTSPNDIADRFFRENFSLSFAFQPLRFNI